MDASGFITAIQTKTPAIFIRCGDGELYAIQQRRGGNCDGTPYTPRLRISLQLTFTELLKHPRLTLGKWHVDDVIQYITSIAPTDREIPWGSFSMFFFQTLEEFHSKCAGLYRAIRYANQQKIFICNENLVSNSKLLFNIDEHVTIHPTNWFETTFDETYSKITSKVRESSNVLFLVSAGMGGKYLMYKLSKDFPESIILDIGSAFDLICGLRRTRSYHTLSVTDIQTVWKLIQEPSV